MRSNLRILVAVAATLLVAPMAMAASVEEQLQTMNERMEQLENQLDATQDELDASKDQVDRQQDVLEKAGLERQAKSGISGFYQSVEISGHLAGSWFWNFNDPGDGVLDEQNTFPGADGSANGGYNGAFYPFHPDHNSFNVDQLWLTLHKPATEESRAGFKADFVYGRTASVLNFGSSDDVCGNDTLGDCASEFNLFEAYIEYLTPFGPTVKVGKMETWLGRESVNTTKNWNITRGNVYTLLQPFNHVGVVVEGDVNGFTYGLGAVNDWSWRSPDNNNDKHILAKLGYGTEMFSGQVAFLWGSETGAFPGDSIRTRDIGTVDLLLTADPTEAFSAYFDFTYKWEGSGAPQAWGAALAGRYGFTEKLGYALRGEFVQSNGGSSGLAPIGGPDGNLNTVLVGGTTVGQGRDVDIYGVTGTLDYLITDNLTVKWEVRYDYIDSNGNCGEFSNTQSNDGFADFGCSNQFSKNESSTDSGGVESVFQFTRRSQVTTGLELVYQF